MRDKEAKRDDEDTQEKLTVLYDDLTLFSQQCAFLCDAFASIPAQQGLVSEETVEGMALYSHWLKSRVLEIKGELQGIREDLA